MVAVKVCGITSVEDALACVDAGVASIGLSFVPQSPCRVSVELARTISDAIAGRALVVGVVADLDVTSMLKLRDAARLGCLQLHGDERPEALRPLLPHAYKALRVADEADASRADGYPGDYLLVDANVDGALGGPGARMDASLLVGLARRRRLTLGGGLRPDNVAAVVAEVRPFAVDLTGGAERPGEPRRKDLAAVAAFVRALQGF